MMEQIARTELRLHTNASNDTSLISPRDVMQAAVQLGVKAIAVTDQNSVQSFPLIAGFRERYGKDLKVIYGMELAAEKATVLVKDQQGLKPLYKLVSGKPITDTERQHLLFGVHGADLVAADAEALRRFDYIELGTRHDRDLNRRLYDLGKKLGKPVVAVGNCHYLYPHHQIAKTVLDKMARNVSCTEETHLRTTEEMLAQYGYLGEDAALEVVVTNPNAIADSIGFVDPNAKLANWELLPDAEATVRRLCEEKLASLYGEQPQVKKRLAQELDRLGENASMFLLCHKIVQHLHSKGGLAGFRGLVGSTLMAWLLEISDINPLPAHHRCPTCRHTEFIAADSGFDLPKKPCPHCGKLMVGDGHNIPFETCLGVTDERRVDIDLSTTDAMRQEAKQFLADLLGKDRLAAAGTVSTYSQKIAQSYVARYEAQTGDELPGDWVTNLIPGVKRCEGIHPVGIFLLPEGMEWENVTPLRPNDDEICEFVTHMEWYVLDELLPRLDIMTAGYYDRLQALFAATGAKPQDIDYQDPKVYAVFQRKDTKGIPEFDGDFAGDLLDELGEVSFSGLIRVGGMVHGTNVWWENGKKLSKAHPFRELIANREDVFLYLCQYGVDRETAYAAMTATRKGRFGDKEAVIEKMRQANIPAWYLESMQKIFYLFPKAHAAHYSKLAYTAAWFKVYYPEAFRKVMSQT